MTDFDDAAWNRALAFVKLINRITGHPFLGSKIAVMGGAAFGLFGRTTTRLPVDLDLAYIGARDEASVLADQPRIASALSDILRDLELEQAATIAGDVHFLSQAPLSPLVRRNSQWIGNERAEMALIVDDYDLAASKLVAAVQRSSSRDLFDAREHLQRPDLDHVRLRTAFVVYGALKVVDWRAVNAEGINAAAVRFGSSAQRLPRSDLRTSQLERIATNTTAVRTDLLPLLRVDLRPAASELESWTTRLIDETRSLMAAVLPLEPRELAFLNRLHDAGEITPQLLTATEQAAIRAHPGLTNLAQKIQASHGADIDAVHQDEMVLKFRWHVRSRS